MAVGPVAASAADGFTAPPPRMLELLRREHHPSQWLIVTTTSGPLDVSVGAIGEAGLLDLKALTPAAASAPTSIPWSSIERIDRRVSRFLAGRVTGFVLGAVAGGYAGATLGESASSREHSYGDVGAFVGIVTGSVAGGWFGGELGDRSATRHPLYVARAHDPAHERPADSSEPVVAHLGHLRSSISPHDIVRVRGSFGEFTGRVSTIDPDGRTGLERVPELDSAQPLPSEPLGEDEIRRLERRGTSSKALAAAGGIVLAVAAGSIGAAVSAALGNTSGDVTAAFAAGAAAGGIAGIGIGAIIGSFIPSWHIVFDRPLAATASVEPTDP